MARWRIWAFTLGILFVSGCSRPVSNHSTKITIQAPVTLGKIDSLATMPANRKVCYGVNISGPGIKPEAVTVTCAQTGMTAKLDVGLLAGFVEPGQEVSLDVPSGSERRIELFAYLLAVGNMATPCPKFDKFLSPNMLTDIYKVGTAENILIQGAQQTVEMTADYPGDNSHLAASLNLPANCAASAPSSHGGFQVSSGMQEAAGTGIKLKARIGSVQGATTLSNANYKLYVK